MRNLALATEDELSEVVGLKLVDAAGADVAVSLTIRRNGFGYLKSKMRNFCELARTMPVLLLTDLDTALCPSAMIGEWSRKDAVPSGLLFRVAVRQVESWLLADREGMANLMDVSVRQLPSNPDSLPDAKRFLLQLANKAPRKVRDELLASRGAMARQGMGYNALLSDFVRLRWNPIKAATRSDSLSRARSRLSLLADRR
jgi:hypothetical protein